MAVGETRWLDAGVVAIYKMWDTCSRLFGDENPIFQLKHLGFSWSWQQQTGGVKGFELQFMRKRRERFAGVG